jgi:glycosyltransferase involved in cell wall biosynthesis
MRHPAVQPNVLLLSTADWNMPIWTNNQFVASALAECFPVQYMESLGLRKPQLRSADVVRMVRRAGRLLVRQQPHNQPSLRLRVKPTALIPSHSSRLVTAVNAQLLRHQARDWLRVPRPARALWTFSPVTYGLESAASVTVYHCVDLLGQVPGVDAELTRRSEAHLARAGATAIASSSKVAEHLRGVGFREPILWENVADVGLFTRAVAAGRARRPNVIFAGRLSEYKIDFPLLGEVARALASTTDARLILAGPIQKEPSVLAQLAGLERHRVDVTGPLTPSELAQQMATATVGIVPYLCNGYTNGVFPLKLFEYLAAGLFVVAVRLPSLRSRADEDVSVTGDRRTFVEAVLGGLRSPTESEVGRRQRKAAPHSWPARGRAARELLTSLVAESAPMRIGNSLAATPLGRGRA